MLRIKWVIAIALMSFVFGTYTDANAREMNGKETVVIAYNYSQEQVMIKSSALLKKVSNTLHIIENDDVVLLAENKIMVIPDINESHIFFDGNFLSADLYPQPTVHWFSFNEILSQIRVLKEKLEPIKKSSIQSEEFDLNKLTKEFLKNETHQSICLYNLDRYKIAVVLNKLDSPQEIHPRNEDYFRLIVKVENRFFDKSANKQKSSQISTNLRPKIVDKFLENTEKTVNYLSEYGSSARDKNKGIILSYKNSMNTDPMFIWFPINLLATIKIGESIEFYRNAGLRDEESTNSLWLGFFYANQVIYNNILPLYHLYLDYGVEGLTELQKWDDNAKYISPAALRSFQKYDWLKVQAASYALKMNLSPNDPVVVQYILSRDGNREILTESSMLLMEYAQHIAQPMYDKVSFNKTVAETLNS